MELDINKAEKLADNIYNTSVVLDYFYKSQQHSEDLCNVSPLIAYILNKSDILYSMIVNVKADRI